MIINDLSGALGIESERRYFLSYGSGSDAFTIDGETGTAGFEDPAPEQVLCRKVLHHPLVSASQWHAIQNNLLDEIQGKRSIYYAGSWTNGGEGSHEYAYISGRKAAAMVLGEPYEALVPKPVSPVHAWISRALCLTDRHWT